MIEKKKMKMVHWVSIISMILRKMLKVFQGSPI